MRIGALSARDWLITLSLTAVWLAASWYSFGRGMPEWLGPVVLLAPLEILLLVAVVAGLNAILFGESRREAELRRILAEPPILKGAARTDDGATAQRLPSPAASAQTERAPELHQETMARPNVGLSPAATQARDESSKLPARTEARPARSEPTLPQTVLLDDYIVERRLGAGGQGEVLLVRSRSTGTEHAVKRANVRATNMRDIGVERRRLLSELGVWIDLPEHPSLARLNFVRTAGSDVLLFAEYVEGGSLIDWIDRCRVVGMKELLAVALRSAWAMHVAHALGVVHQDIKPENFLVAGDGAIKLGDFGLATARRSQGDHTVGVQGFTPAYRPPEQVIGGRVDARSDIFSWAASVLKIWLGANAAWADGQALAYETSMYLRTAPQEGRPRIPETLATVLGKCLDRDPARRIATAGELVRELRRVYEEATGAPFLSRLADPPARRPDEDRTAIGVRRWKPGEEWLARARGATGGATPPPSPALGRSWRSKCVSDLISYEEAASLLAAAAGTSRDLANLHADKAFVHAELGDMPGARASFDEAAAFFENDAQVVRSREAVESWTQVCKSFAWLALRARRHDWALDACARAARTIERARAAGSPGTSSAGALADIEADRGDIFVELGDVPRALESFDRALRALESCGERDTVALHAKTRCTQGRAKAVFALGRPEMAIAACDRLVATLDQSAAASEAQWANTQLAIVITDKAHWLRHLGRLDEALRCHDRAISIAEQLAAASADAEEMLAMYCQNKAYVARLTGDVPVTLDLLARGIELRERIAARTQDSEARAAVAEAYSNAAIDLQHLSLTEEAFPMFDTAIGIYVSLVDGEGRQEFLPKLGRAYSGKAACLLASAGPVFAQGVPQAPHDDAVFTRVFSRFIEAKDLQQRAAVVFERLWSEIRAPHYAVDLARVKLNLAAVHNLLLERDAAHVLANEVLRLRDELAGEGQQEQLREIVAAAEALLARNRRDDAMMRAQ